MAVVALRENTVPARVARYLHENPDSVARDISDNLSVPRNQIYSALNKFAQVNAIVRADDKDGAKYSINASNKRFLKEIAALGKTTGALRVTGKRKASGKKKARKPSGVKQQTEGQRRRRRATRSSTLRRIETPKGKGDITLTERDAFFLQGLLTRVSDINVYEERMLELIFGQ